MKRLRKILYLAANPVGTERLGLIEEYREMRGEIERSKYRHRFEVVRCEPTPRELPEELRRHKPLVAHFSCHGYRAGELKPASGAPHREAVGQHGSEQGLIATSDDGHAQLISSTDLQEIFAVEGSSVKLVVLAACFTEQLAAALLTSVDCVVGMQGAIHDDAARHFTVGFYKGIVEGKSIQEAFRQGRLAIRLEGLHGDVDRPQLRVRDGLDPSKIILATETPARSARRRGRQPRAMSARSAAERP